MKKGQPITPDEAFNSDFSDIPAEVFDAFNELLAQRSRRCGNKIVIKQEEVIFLILKKFNHVHERQHIFENKWLDVEKAYEIVGWNVTYDKPGYNEEGEAYFEFSAKRPENKR